MSGNDYEKIKLMTLGNSDVGKSSFILRYTGNSFNQYNLSTQGIDLQTKYVKFDEKTYRIDFYDTAGQEQYKSIAYNIIKNADGIVLMYDITQIKTFEDITEWMANIEENKQPNVKIILLGNKCDLKETREITTEEGKELAEKYKIDFFEISNKDGTNVEEAGNTLVKKIIEIKKTMNKDIEDNKVIENIKIKKSSKKSKKHSCC